uniref:Uncharacterized protein n=1 Tax=Glossina pallidipes TaxID=7398 RepID=A0A1B0ABE2_GLOPL
MKKESFLFPIFLTLQYVSVNKSYSHVSHGFLEYVRHARTAKEMWNTLCPRFECKCAQSNTLIRKELARIRLREGEESLARFINSDAPIKQLKPGSYDPTVTTVENLSSDELTLGQARTRLLGEEAKKTQPHIEKLPKKLCNSKAVH